MLQRNVTFGQRNSGLKSAPPTLRREMKAKPENNALLEAIVGEVQGWSISAIMIGSHFNAPNLKTEKNPCSELLRLIPKEAAVLGVIQNGMVDTRLSRATLNLLKQAWAGFSESAALIADYNLECGEMGPERASILHQASLTAAWRSVSSKLVKLQAQMVPEISVGLNDLYSPNWDILQPLLVEVSKGKAPCINSDGQIVEPDLPQRRHNTRVSLLQACIVRYGNHSFPALARDISTGGIGIDRAHHLPIGQMISVELQHGRNLSGRVVWSGSGRLGIALESELDPRDPLLFG